MPYTRTKSKQFELKNLVILAVLFATLFIATILISSQLSRSKKTGQLFDNQSRASEQFTFCHLISDRYACQSKAACQWEMGVTREKSECVNRGDNSGTTQAP